MVQVRKKTLDKATENVVSQAAAAGIPLAFDRYEDMSPVCRFGLMGLDCKACTQGPCRVNPFDATNGTTCGRDRENIVASSFLRLVCDGAVANATFAGAQGAAAGAIFEGIAAANEGMLPPAQLLAKAVAVAGAGYEALAGAPTSGRSIEEIEVGLGALKADKINVLMLGNIPAAQAEKIAKELAPNRKLNLVGATGAGAAGSPIAGNYGSEEALLVSTCVDGVIAGTACVSPGFLALAARQGVPVMAADRFNEGDLLERAEAHFRVNQGRNLASKFPPAKAVVGFTSAAFSSVAGAQWSGLADLGVKGVALIGGCNNAMATQDGPAVRMAGEFLANGFLVIANGCAATGLAKAGYMDPARAEALAGKKLPRFLNALSETLGSAVPAVLEAGSCWEIPAAMEMARYLAQKLNIPIAAAMPELSRPAGWSSALAVAAQGVPTYVGPVFMLDGGLQTVSTLNEQLKTKGGSLVGPAQAGDPEAFVNTIKADS